jgi:hypothetical protein
VNIGKRFQGDASGAYSMPGLSPGAFVARYWAEGYLVKDVLITLTTSESDGESSNSRRRRRRRPRSPGSTPVSPSHRIVHVQPGPSINCTVDSGSSTGIISSRKWKHAGKEVVDVKSRTALEASACSDLVGSRRAPNTARSRFAITGFFDQPRLF